MRAIRLHTFGGPERLRLETSPDSRSGEGSVRIRVPSAGVHVLDMVIRRTGAAGGTG